MLCVDYGTSIYAQKKLDDGIEVVNVDFNTFKATEKFDLVWASHVLEHQRDIGSFIERLMNCCSCDGYVSITLPDPHGISGVAICLFGAQDYSPIMLYYAGSI